MPRAMTSMRAPQESPALRSSSMRASSAGTMSAFGAKNGFNGIWLSSTNGIAMSPSWLIQPMNVVPQCCASHLRATAPAATIGAVSRADERPPPRGSRRPYLRQ